MIALQLTPNDISIIQHALNIATLVLDADTAPETVKRLNIFKDKFQEQVKTAFRNQNIYA